MTDNIGNAGTRFNDLVTSRQPFLDRARDAAKYTIPSLIPLEGHTPTAKFPTPYQSLGAKGVNNLAGKMLLALLPPSSPFFRLMPSERVTSQLQEGEQSELEEALSQVEMSVLREIEGRAVRAHAFEAFKHLIVAGNVLLFLPKKGVRVFPLSQYVVKRDPEGNVLEIVTKECLSPKTLPEAIRESVKGKLKGDEKTVDVYTHILREDKEWEVYQEVKGITVPDSEGTYPLDKSPWLPLRWTRIDGEDYGRGLCEEYLGDLISMEELSKAIVQFAAVAAKVIFLTKPGGMTRAEVIAEAPTGAVRDGDVDDVGVLGLDKFPDFQIAKSVLDTIDARLSYAFLLNSSIRRNAERVTAEEIRVMANELEEALGGVYTLMASEFQLPLVSLIMIQMEKEQRLPKLPEKTVRPTIITGLDALGRSHELMRLDAFLGGALQTFGPAAAQRIKLSDYLTRRATALGINTKGLIKSEEEYAQELQQQAQMQLTEKLGPTAITEVSKQSLAAQKSAGETATQ